MKWLDKAYHWWLEFWGRPGFHYTDQLRYIARKRPWLFVVVGLPIFLLVISKIAYDSKYRVAWMILAGLIFIFTTWLLLHLGAFA